MEWWMGLPEKPGKRKGLGEVSRTCENSPVVTEFPGRRRLLKQGIGAVRDLGISLFSHSTYTGYTKHPRMSIHGTFFFSEKVQGISGAGKVGRVQGSGGAVSHPTGHWKLPSPKNGETVTVGAGLLVERQKNPDFEFFFSSHVLQFGTKCGKIQNWFKVQAPERT